MLDGLQRFDDGKLFNSFKNTALFAQTRRIDELKRPAVILKLGFNRVARRARHIVGNEALFPQKGVDERGLTDIGATCYRHLDALRGVRIGLFGLFFVLSVHEGLKHGLQEA